ncbi:MAG: hypothetical protein K6L81_05010 [Agarilytica sp.]
MRNNPQTWMRTVSILVVCILNVAMSFSAAAQTQNDQMARAYYFEAQRAVAAGTYGDALSAINKAESLLGSSNASTTALKVKIYFGQGKYQAAKQALNTFYTLKSGENLAREMAVFLTKVDKKIIEEKSRIESERRAAIVKAEQDRLAAIAAKKARIEAETLRQQQAERDRLAQLAQQAVDAKQALQDQFQSCENGRSVFDCFVVAERYEFGRDGYPKNLEKAAIYYGKSCRPKKDDKHKGCFGRVRLLFEGYDASEKTEEEISTIVSHKRRYGGYRGGNADGVDWFFFSGKVLQKSVNYADSHPFLESNSLAARYYYGMSCELGNKKSCDAAKKIVPDMLQKAVEQYVACENGPLNKGAACYEFAQILEKDKHVYKYLRSEYPHYAITQYLKTNGLRIYPAKTFPRYIEPAKFYRLACDDHQYPDACFVRAENSYKYAQEYNYSFESWVALFREYEISCEETTPMPVNHAVGCKRRDTIKLKLTQELEAAKTNCITPTTYGAEEDCTKIATAYKTGFMVAPDSSKVLEYLLRSCTLGGWSNCRDAAAYAEEGAIILPPDFENPAEYYGKACKRYPTLFCIRAGEMYLKGDGVKQDAAMAKAYYKILLKRKKKICKGAAKDSNSCREYDAFKAEYREKF